jgi:uncharacterized membrane protein YoaK (UPF0700 family)
VDAASYLSLGSVFTANMTGNTVLLGIAVAEGDGGHAARSAAALGGFCVGAALGTLVPGTAAGLALEALLLALLALLGELAGVPRVPLILLGGTTMGLQTSSVRRSNDTGVNVTYVTGTVTTLVTRATRALLRREREEDAEDRGIPLPGSVWVCYALGGLIGALLVHDLIDRWAFLPAAAAVLLGALVPRAPSGYSTTKGRRPRATEVGTMSTDARTPRQGAASR